MNNSTRCIYIQKEIDHVGYNLGHPGWIEGWTRPASWLPSSMTCSWSQETKLSKNLVRRLHYPFPQTSVYPPHYLNGSGHSLFIHFWNERLQLTGWSLELVLSSGCPPILKFEKLSLITILVLSVCRDYSHLILANSSNAIMICDRGIELQGFMHWLTIKNLAHVQWPLHSVSSSYSYLNHWSYILRARILWEYTILSYRLWI